MYMAVLAGDDACQYVYIVPQIFCLKLSSSAFCPLLMVRQDALQSVDMCDPENWLW